MRISANLGFLFTELDLPDAIRAAKGQGFDAVELHWPYDHAPHTISQALEETGLPLLSVNTIRGDIGAGEFGLAALPGREREARSAIDQAVEWASATRCRYIHVMAGKAGGDLAFRTFADNLVYACDVAGKAGVGVLIEPLNPVDVLGYFLTDISMARRLVQATGGRAKIMFDCYHMEIIAGDLLNAVKASLPDIGHIQFASVPDRAEPDHGDVDYAALLPAMLKAGYSGFFGAEYRPKSKSFAWLGAFRG